MSLITAHYTLYEYYLLLEIILYVKKQFKNLCALKFLNKNCCNGNIFIQELYYLIILIS